MARSRWKAVGTLEPDREYLVLASSIPTRRRSSAVRMFRGARRIRRQLDHTPGLVGYSLLAEPHRNRYATLSVWADQLALDAFAAAEPHRELSNDLAGILATSHFERWTIRGAAGLPTWADALERLETGARQHAPSTASLFA